MIGGGAVALPQRKRGLSECTDASNEDDVVEQAVRQCLFFFLFFFFLFWRRLGSDLIASPRLSTVFYVPVACNSRLQWLLLSLSLSLSSPVRSFFRFFVRVSQRANGMDGKGGGAKYFEGDRKIVSPR